MNFFISLLTNLKSPIRLNEKNIYGEKDELFIP